MVAEPSFTPVTVGCVAGVVWPELMVTLAGEIVTLLVLLLLSDTVTFAGAGCGSVTAKVAVCPRFTLVLEGRLMAPGLVTVIDSVVLGMFGAAVLAVIVAVPTDTPVTGTLTVVAPAAKFTVAGTVATDGVSELRLMVKPPAGAAPERFNTAFCVVTPVTVRLGCAKLMVAFTCTVVLAGVIPVPDALMLAEPVLTPLTAGWFAGVVWPARIVMLAGEIVSLVVSLLVRAIVRSADAGLARLTANAVDLPMPTVRLDGSVTVAGADTVTFSVASAISGVLLAWITAEPAATAVTTKVAVLWPEVKVTVEGTVATLVLLELTFTVTPDAGAGADRLRVTFWGPVPVMVRLLGV
jgi:hypothetical protein